MQLLVLKLSLASVLLATYQVTVAKPFGAACSALLLANHSVAAGPTIDIKAKYVWNLIFDYDNSGNSGSIVHSYQVVQSGSYTAQTFNEAVTSETKRLSETGSIQVEVGASYGPVSASVKAGYESSKEVNNFLQTTTREQTEQTISYSRTESREYTVGPRSRLVLYQRVFQGPGISVQDATFRTTPTPLPPDQLQQDILVSLGLTQRSFIKSLKVAYGDQPSQAPAIRVRDWFGGNDDINAKFGGKYVWLVPEWTTQVSQAMTRFDLIIQNQADNRYSDLAAGAGGAYRYLVGVREPNKTSYISDLTLARAGSPLTNIPNVIWVGLPQGATGDINAGRGGDYLYLVWELQRAYPI